jgi:isoleucyl-tRNA synthetase
MYEMYADGTKADHTSTNVLDRWIISRLNQLIGEATIGYENYELDKATRPMADFIDDLSVWYLRRSRERLKGDDGEDRTATIATLRFVLRELAKVMAPAMPFYAEYLYRVVRDESEAESVHLTKWPAVGGADQAVIDSMKQVREVVTAALEARTKSGIKVRQPIASVTGPDLLLEYRTIVLDELNAKEYKIGDAISIDTTLTPELIAEGAVREVMRAVQDMRKAAHLEPRDNITLRIATTVAGQAVLDAHRDLFVKTVNASDLQYGETTGTEIIAGEYQFTVHIEPVTL